MTRRRLIAAASLVGITGCLSVDELDEPVEPTQDNDDTTDPEVDDAPEESAEIDPEDVPEGEDQLVFGDLEITEHELIVEENLSEVIEVMGLVTNTGEQYDYVEVRVRIYSDEGHHLGSYIGNTIDLAEGGTWEFTVMIFGHDSEEIAEYDIAVIGERY